MKTTKRFICSPLALCGLAALASALAFPLRSSASSPSGPLAKPAATQIARAAAQEGAIAARLTTPEELQGLLGKPDRKKRGHEGDQDVLLQDFSEVTATFVRLGELPGPFTLLKLKAAGEPIDIGLGRQLSLRTTNDLTKLDSFWGLSGVSLTKLDLRDQVKLLSKLTFDSLTLWPEADKLPEGFAPARLLEEGKNPGLGVATLQKAGIDGRGIGIAIIDQPLLLDHVEYQERIVKYEAVEVENVPPQMHGPAVASIAVGKNCGVAPGAALYYFAVPAWKWLQNEPWAEQLERIVEFNKTLRDTPKIRVVSISLGAFSIRTNLSRWRQAVQKAEEANILVVTCDPGFLALGTLKRIEGRSKPGPADYERGIYSQFGATLCVPAANRTIASFRGRQAYTYDRMGGMSWTVPYLAGVAALGWQVAPDTKPKEMVQVWLKTATRTAAGPVIAPAAIIEALKSRP